MKIDQINSTQMYQRPRSYGDPPLEPADKTEQPPDRVSLSPSSEEEALTDSEQRKVAELKRIDQEVRTHEAAHMAAGSGITRGGASFSFTRGPDGVLYATGGEVPIDSSKGQTPEETLQKMNQVKRAALAPANPSPQDRKVAAQAAARAAQASQEIAARQREAVDGTDDGATEAAHDGSLTRKAVNLYAAIAGNSQPQLNKII